MLEQLRLLAGLGLMGRRVMLGVIRLVSLRTWCGKLVSRLCTAFECLNV